jgi:hypothetical protein
MRGDALPWESKPGKEVTFPSINVSQKCAVHDLDIVMILANHGLRYPMFALPGLRRRRNPVKNCCGSANT